MKFTISLILTVLLCGSAAAQQEEYYGYDYDEDQSDDELADPYLYMLLSLPVNSEENPFEQVSRYGFSAVRYSRRGYDYSFSRFNVGGIELNDAIEGSVYWDLLRSLSDYRDMSNGSFGTSDRGSRPASFSERTEYDLSAQAISPHIRVGLIMSDRLYTYGLNVKAADIFEKSGFYYALTASMRSGDDQHIDGVYREEMRFNALAGRQWNNGRHEIAAYASFAPIEQGLRGAATQESFDLTGNNLYNPYWGYDENGEIVASRVRDNAVGMGGLRYKYSPSEMTVFEFDAALITGTTSTQTLGWNSVANPYANYYTYMPSYFDNQNVSTTVSDAWRAGDTDFTQISWARLIAANRGDGISPACYYIEGWDRHIINYQGAASFTHAMRSGFEIRGGANINLSSSHYYKTLVDDLGGLFIYDTDPFVLMNDDYVWLSANNLLKDGLKIEVGDKFGYNYIIDHNKYGAWFGGRYDRTEYSLYADLSVASSTFTRVGYYQKALYNSNITLGSSPNMTFDDYSFVAGGRLSLSNYSYFEAQVTAGALPPEVDDIFFDAEGSEMTPEDVSSTQYYGFELSFRHLGNVDLYASVYGTATRSESRIYRYYDDLNSMFVHAAYCDIAKNYLGFEASASVPLSERFSLTSTAAMAYNVYAADMTAEVQAFLSGETISTGMVSHVDGLRVDGSPQSVANLKLEYRGLKMFNASLGASVMADNYISISPLQRNERSLSAATSPENLAELMDQERFATAFTLDMSLSKTFEINGHYLSFFLSISNLLDKRDIVYSGYEQNRLYSVGDDVNSSWAAPDSKYYYGYGRTMYMSINFSF